MANEFKIKNALKILNTHAVTGISNDSSIFSEGAETSGVDASSLVTAKQIKAYIGLESSTANFWQEDSSIITLKEPDFDLEMGSILVEEDAGNVTLVDMPITATPTLGTEESYSFDIDGSSIITVYSESDGVGGLSEMALVVDAAYQYMGLPNVDNSWRFFVDPSTDLVFEKRVSGVWTSGGKFSV